MILEGCQFHWGGGLLKSNGGVQWFSKTYLYVCIIMNQTKPDFKGDFL